MSMPSSRGGSTPAFLIAAAWAIAILGLGAALIGAYLLLAPEDGRLTIINQTWAVSELRDAWPQVLLICGGAVSFAAMGLALLTQRAMTANYVMAMSALVLAGCGAVAVVAGALVAG